jgi:uncharacterized membrane protein
MLVYSVSYIAASGLFFIVDMVWLSIMASRFYRPTLGDMALSGVNVAPAIAFYILYPIGLVIFAILPGLRSGSMTTALLYGALFGFFTYATYDLTNQATLRNWTIQLTLVDIAWGSALAAAAAMAGYLIAIKLSY